MDCCLKKVWGCVLALALFFVFSQFIFPGLVSRLEQTVRDEFQLEKDAVVAVRQGSAFDAVQGRFRFLMLKADAAVIDGLPVEDLLLRSDDVTIDVWRSLTGGDVEITGMGRSFIEFRVAEQPLVDRWAPELASKNLQKPELTLDDGLAKVSAVFSIGPLEPRVAVSGKIEPTGDGEVRFSASNIEIAGADINMSAISSAFKTLDPVVDLGQLQLDVNISKITVDDGYIYIAADSTATGTAASQPADEGNEAELNEQGGLLERFKKISQVDHEERVQQLEQLYEELKQQGVSTAEQVREYAQRQLAGWEDEYHWLLEELNRVVEDQIAALEAGEDKAESDEQNAEQDPDTSGEE